MWDSQHSIATMWRGRTPLLCWKPPLLRQRPWLMGGPEAVLCIWEWRIPMMMASVRSFLQKDNGKLWWIWWPVIIILLLTRRCLVRILLLCGLLILEHLITWLAILISLKMCKILLGHSDCWIEKGHCLLNMVQQTLVLNCFWKCFIYPTTQMSSFIVSQLFKQLNGLVAFIYIWLLCYAWYYIEVPHYSRWAREGTYFFKDVSFGQINVVTSRDDKNLWHQRLGTPRLNFKIFP